MKNRLRLIWQAIRDKPILSGITFTSFPHLEAEDLIIRNCVFPRGTRYTAGWEFDRPIEEAEGRVLKRDLRIVGCYTTGETKNGIKMGLN